MFIFIALSLALCFLVQTASPLLNILDSQIVIYIGVALAVGCMVGNIVKKKAAKIWHDVFAGSVLIVWFAYWRSSFNEDSPIFFFFPLYFVFMAAFIELFFAGQHQKIDTATLRQMQSLVKNISVQPWMVMLGVLVSLEWQQHYLLYPVMMTLLLVRFALFSYLELE
ncbi:MAG: hypothetical protein Q8N96_13585 [Methylovulum sp.]|nr:hypothetical protein [Methylovulum sp.]